MKRASQTVPRHLLAPFIVREAQWIVRPGLLGKRVVCVPAIEQEFVGKSLEEELADNVARGSVREAKKLIDDAFAIQVEIWRCGYFNCDANILSDTRIDDAGNLLFVDVGDLTADLATALRCLRKLSSTFAHVFSVQSLHALSPELAEHYLEQFSLVYSLENLEKQWAAANPPRNSLTEWRPPNDG
jgi:hypothetical protein